MIITYGPLPSTTWNRSLGALLPVSLVLFFYLIYSLLAAFRIVLASPKQSHEESLMLKALQVFFQHIGGTNFADLKLDFSMEIRTNNSSRDINGWRKSGDHQLRGISHLHGFYTS